MTRSEEVLKRAEKSSKYGRLMPLPFEAQQAQSEWLLERFDAQRVSSYDLDMNGSHMTHTYIEPYRDEDGEAVNYSRPMFQLLVLASASFGEKYSECYCGLEGIHYEEYGPKMQNGSFASGASVATLQSRYADYVQRLDARFPTSPSRESRQQATEELTRYVLLHPPSDYITFTLGDWNA